MRGAPWHGDSSRGHGGQDPARQADSGQDQTRPSGWGGFATLRDALTYLVAVGVLVKAVWFSSGGVNLELVLAAVGLLGLPAATAADERRRNR